MKRLAPFRGTLFRLALTNALVVGLVGLAFLQLEDIRTQRDGSGAGLGFGRSLLGRLAAQRAPAASKFDEEFMRRAAELAGDELRLAEVGAQRATRLEVRNFARELAARQQAARSEIEMLAARRGVLLPTGESRPSDVDSAAAMSRERFDDTFVELAKARHGTALQLFERAADECADPELRRFADRRLPQLQAEHEHARRLGRTVF